MSSALIVEDSLTDMEIISTCLQESGFEVIKARNETEALDSIGRQTFNLIVLDVVLPGRSGFELCRQLKSSEETKDIPIVMCSTKSGDLDKFWGMKQGADAYVSKPIDREDFLRVVADVVKH